MSVTLTDYVTSFSNTFGISNIQELSNILSTKCFKDIIPSKVIGFVINLFLHAMILITVLYFFFLYIINPIVIDSMNGEFISNGKNQLIKPLLRDPTYGPYIKTLPYNTLLKVYNNPDPTSTNKNRVLYFSWGVIIGILLLFLILSIISTRFLTCYEYSLTHIFLENLAIFSLIGAFEGAFFYYIGQKYVPVMPSYITNVFLDRIIVNFS